MNVDKIKDDLPGGSVIYATGDTDNPVLAITVPADGFEKLVAYQDSKRDWVHKDYQEAPKKSKKKKKRG